LGNLEGLPHQIIHYYRAVVNFGRQTEGLKGAYKVLLQNWQDMKCHLAFSSVFFSNDTFTDIELNPSTVATNCVVTLATSDGKKRVRIEDESYAAFEDERLSSSSDLATALIGKKVGDEITVGLGFAVQQYKIEAIKSVELDAFHASLEAFNTRFPNSNSMIKLSIDMDAEDPLAEMREITKQAVERDKSILDMYRENAMPLAFLAALLGKDILECWAGLGSEGIPFKCSRGIAAEREGALAILGKTDPVGIVVDTVTLNVIYKVGALGAVQAACGPIKIAQSTMDLLANRVLEARQAKGRQKGVMAWQDNRLVMTEITNADWDGIIEYREAMLDWARENTETLSSVPRTELTGQVRDMVNIVGVDVVTPAIAAQTAGLCLLSDDFRFREWVAEEFNIPTSWLQPVLMTALEKDALNSEEYCRMVNTLALMGHDYVSLNSQCLSQQFREGGFEITADLTKLLNILGGSNADLGSNLFVASSVIDSIWIEPCPHHKKLRLVGEIMRVFTTGRWEHADKLWRYFVKGCQEMRTVLMKYFQRWMVGHSLGAQNFLEVRQKYQE
jgi:Transcription elongation factor, GreA/GreB, C-term